MTWEINNFFMHVLTRANPVYAGKIAYGKNVTEKVKGTRDQFRRVKSDDYLLVDGIHEAIKNCGQKPKPKEK